MGNTEKDIKFIEEMIKEYKTFGDLHNADYEDTDKIYKALENILSACRNSIPKQTVKDKIENLKEQRRTLGFKTYLRIEDMLNDDKAIMHKISTLEELLEEG